MEISEKQTPNIYWIDLFAGAGGTSTGIHLAGCKVVACVNHDATAIAAHAANHPDTIHFTEDIRDFAVVEKLKAIVADIRFRDPLAVICIWASLECTNFSKAKGGLPRDADSRTLAEHMFMYLHELVPDYFWVENVREFMAWGPLDDKGKPVSRNAGRDFVRWVNYVKACGFRSDWKILNAADFGAYQSRERLFMQFVRGEYPMAWPQQTHTKDRRDGGLFPMKKWKAVREVLDLEDEGKSIFDRKKPLSENTLKRILAGLNKFVAKGDKTFMKQFYSGNDQSRVFSVDGPARTITGQRVCQSVVCAEHFIAKYYSGRPEGKVISIEGPAGTVKTADGQSLVKAKFMHQRSNFGDPASHIFDLENPARTVTTNGGNQDVMTVDYLTTYYGNGGAHDIEQPCPTVTTKDRVGKLKVVFVDQQYGNSYPASIDVPLGTLTGNPKFALVKPQFVMNQYTGGGQHTDIDGPAATVTNVPKSNLISAEPWLMNTNFDNVGRSIDDPAFTLTASRRHPYLVNANSSTCPPQDIDAPAPSVTSRTHLLINPSWYGNPSSVEGPSCTIVARQDKAPMYLMAAEHGPVAWIVFDDDSETMIGIKRFMVEYGITDIKMRMLKIVELLQIQGFPKTYKLKGNQTEQKKQIGNAVEVHQSKAIAATHREALEQHFQLLSA